MAKLIAVYGSPGSGKTTTWIIVNKVDRKKGIKKKNLAQPD